MANTDNVIRAFSEEHVERLTGLTKAQLRYWDRTGFFRPNYADDDRRNPYSRIYSFRDVVGLRTLGVLRKEYKVSLQHLREVAAHLSDLGYELWSKTVLYVLNRRVVIHEDGTGKLIDAITRQLVLGFPMKTIISDMLEAAQKLRVRSQDQIGKIVRHRFIAHNSWVVAGTRIPTQAIKNFAEAGYSIDGIIKEYPDLTEQDVQAALAHEEKPNKAA